MRPILVLHGGAGRIEPRTLERCRQTLRLALAAGYELLLAGGSSLDAVTAAVMLLEDSGLFNAGRGASRNAAGGFELDASIMDGGTRRAGGVAAVSRIRNPVLAARAVMEQSSEVLLVGKGAERFCRSRKLATVKSNYFLSRKKTKTGTVGAVALDRRGNLAAATSTGGYSGKPAGRVGDSPLIGAGTWADNRSCAVSCTGVGEFFIRAAAAYDVAARIKYRKEKITRACRSVINTISTMRGSGGMIAVDRKGNIAALFNSQGMYRAWVSRDGRLHIRV